MTRLIRHKPRSHCVLEMRTDLAAKTDTINKKLV